MTASNDPQVGSYRLPEEPGTCAPLPPHLDTAERWWARARLVRPEAEPAGQVAIGGEWAPVSSVRWTAPIETDADLDATSTAPGPAGSPGSTITRRMPSPRTATPLTPVCPRPRWRE